MLHIGRRRAGCYMYSGSSSRNWSERMGWGGVGDIRASITLGRSINKALA